MSGGILAEESARYRKFFCAMSGSHAFVCCTKTPNITFRSGQLFAWARRPVHAIRRSFLPCWFSLPRTLFHFLVRANTFSCGRSSSICAATVNLAHGICERKIQEHKNEGWQDRLPPVLGVMCNALLLDKHERGLSSHKLADKRSRVERGFSCVFRQCDRSDQREYDELFSWPAK